MMATHWFTPPVPVIGERPGMTYNVNSVEAASEYLVKWTKRGPKWNQAVRACMAAMAGEATAQEAPRCFAEGQFRAAHEKTD
nr:DUF982 domain-containing protein [Mesorhizobium sp. BR1-1-3]